MRKLITVLLSCLFCMSLFAQSAEALQHVMSYGSKGEIVTPRYKLYPTENIYILLKLDTATGALWMVSYSMNTKSDAVEVALDSSSLLKSHEEQIAGRFELYPTKNMFTFLLLDTVWGYTYQVQWSTKANERFRMRIYE